jgi:hypothetical protein
MVVQLHDLEQGHAPLVPLWLQFRSRARKNCAPHVVERQLQFHQLLVRRLVLLLALRGRCVRTRRCATIASIVAVSRNGSSPRSSETRMTTRRIVGVQRREHEVARQRRLHRDLRRLKVADLADEDDVRVLTQEERSSGRTSDPVVVDLALAEPVDVVLDRVLRGEDLGLDARSVRSAPRRASSSCPSRSGRSRRRCRWACAIRRRTSLEVVGAEADRSRLSCTFERSSTRITTDSPNIVGSTATRRSTGLLFTTSSMRPSCGSGARRCRGSP